MKRKFTPVQAAWLLMHRMNDAAEKAAMIPERRAKWSRLSVQLGNQWESFSPLTRARAEAQFKADSVSEVK